MPQATTAWTCRCTVFQASGLLDEWTARALAGDAEAIASIPDCVEHYLVVLARAKK